MHAFPTIADKLINSKQRSSESDFGIFCCVLLLFNIKGKLLMMGGSDQIEPSNKLTPTALLYCFSEGCIGRI